LEVGGGEGEQGARKNWLLGPATLPTRPVHLAERPMIAPDGKR
jgi:hypothetical protein